MADFRVLGPLAVTIDDSPVALGGPRQRRLLAALLMQPGRVVSLDRVLDAVFAGRPSARAEATLRSYATRLRRSLAVVGTDVVVREGIGYRLDVPREDVDAYRFESGVAQARRQADYADTPGAAAVLRGALQMWRGEAYEEFLDEMWAQPEAHRLDEERRAAQELLIDLEMQAGNSSAVVGTLCGLLAVEPFREGLVYRLMMAQYRDGRPVDALQTYAEYRKRAAGELGIDPGPELVELERRVLTRDPALAASAERSLRGYRLGERLGTGRLGTVFAATLPGVARDYAVRVYDAGFADDPRVVRTFESDVRAVAAIDHPALLPLYDAWREPGAATLVMRRMGGGTLQDLLDSHTLTPERARRTLVRVAGAAIALERRGRTHGRIRPTSVLLDESGEAYLAEPALGRADPGGSSDAAGLIELARACLSGVASTSGSVQPWLAELVAAPGLDVPTAVTRILDGLDAAPPKPENPYVGLRAFDLGDADRFFGRQALVRQITDRLHPDLSNEPRLVLLVGGSGSGKSSVVRAGVLPTLHRSGEAWSITVMVPGSDPFRNLEQALTQVRTKGDGIAQRAGPAGLEDAAARSAESPMLLVIDQFEELFTLTSRRDRDRFLDAVATAITAEGARLHVIAALRADYFDRPLDHPRFAALAGRCAVPVPTMTPTELEQTITGPAAGRLRIEPGLVADLVASTVKEPAALPALQFTLHQLAERGGLVLRRCDLQDLGGVDGAIAQRAEELFAALTPDRQYLMRQVLTRLVFVDTDGDSSRRRVSRAELANQSDDPSVVDALIESWVATRLLVGNRRPDTREPTVELAHEAILDRWPRLRAWIDEDRERLLALARLDDAAGAWRDVDRDPAALLRGARLEQAEELLGQSSRRSPLAREFVHHSVLRRADEEQAAHDEVLHRERTSRRLRRQRWLLAVALALALAVGGMALGQRNTATRIATNAAERARAATASLAAASAEATRSDWSLGLLLAAEAHQINPSPATYQALISAITAPRPVPTPVFHGDRRYRTVEVDPVTGTIAVRSAGGVVDLIDPESGARVGGVQALGAGGLDIYDGQVVVGNRRENKGALLEFAGGQTRRVVDLPTGVYETDVEFSPSGDRVAVSDTSGAVTLYDAASWVVVDSLTGEDSSPIEQVAWSESAGQLYALDSRAELMVWEVPAAGQEPVTGSRPADHSRNLNDADAARAADEPLRRETGFGFAELETVPSSPFLIAAPLDEAPWTIDTRDLSASRVIGPDVPRPSRVAVGSGADLTFRADGTSWTISRDETLRSSPLGGHHKPSDGDVVTQWDAVDITVSPTGQVITAGSDGNVTRWDMPLPVPGTVPRSVLDDSSRVEFSPEGGVLVHWNADGPATLADGGGYATISLLPLGSSAVHVLGVAFQSDRSRVLVAFCPQAVPNVHVTCPGMLTAHDAATGSLLAGPVEMGPQRSGPGSPVTSTSDAGIVATSDATGWITLRDPTTLQPHTTLNDLGTEVPSAQQVSVHLSPDGSLLLADPAISPGIAVWDLSGDRPTVAFEADHVRSAVFTPDRTLLARTSTPGGTVRTLLIDTATFSRIDEMPVDAGLLQASATAFVQASATAFGDLMVTSDGEGEVWIWNASDHRPLTTISSRTAALRPDGEALLLWRDGRAYELPLDEDHLLTTACAAAGRNLSEEEWRRHLGADEPYRETCSHQAYDAST